MFQPESAHLVLVEDEESLMMVNLWWIKDMGWPKVHGVASVAELMDYLTASLRQGEPVDLVLMDIVMPEVNGIEGTQLVRKQTAFADLPIIMLTSMKDKDILESAFAAGANDYVIKPFDETELRARIRSALRLKYEVEQRKQREAELMQLSQALISRQIHAESALYQDQLTGIHNRRAFDKKLQDEWIDCYIHQKPLCLIMLDVDHFKQYNDLYGHLVGDKCLQAIARALPESGAGAFSARFGGEEFVVLLPGADAHKGALAAEGIRRRIETLKVSELGEAFAHQLSASLGVASVKPGECPDSQLLLELADMAMYQAKEKGRNQVVTTV